MRNVLVLVVLVGVVLGVLWATTAWVSADVGLLGWRSGSGELRVMAPGPAFLPRWSYERLPTEGGVGARLSVTTSDGSAVDVVLDWRPEPGEYLLEAAEAPAEGFSKSARGPVRDLLAGVSLGCLVSATAEDGGCPEDLAVEASAAVSAAIGASADTVAVSVIPDAGAVRRFLLAEIAGGLPPTDHEVFVLGLDGFDWDLVLQWVEAGRMPNLRRVLRAGTWGTMETLVPMLSPLIWTTLATGASPDHHGILDFVEKDTERDVVLPISGRSRKVPAVWNLASALGRSVGVVGWWASWPAERVNGVVVSDRLYYTLTQGLSKAVFRRDPQDMIFPPERADEFTEIRDRAASETGFEAVRYFMNVPQASYEAAVASDQGLEDPVDGFRRILAASRTYLGAGLRLAAERPELLMVYLEGTDTIGHLLAPYRPPPTLDIDPALASVYVAAVPKYFEIVDRWLGRFLEELPLDEVTLVIVSDHGFKWGKERPTRLSGTAGPTAPLWHAGDAVYVVAGAGARRLGRVDGQASVYDLAPTVAALLGIPADVSWQGTTLPGAPEAMLEPIDYSPLVPPESYRQGGGGEAPVDPEFLAKLEALGYIGGGVSAGAAAPAATSTPPDVSTGAGATAPAADDAATRGQINNLAVIKINQKEYDEAERLLRQAIELSPDYPSPHYNLRRMYVETQRYDDADRELWMAVDKGLRDPERTIDRAAKDYEDMNLQARATALLTEAIRRYPEHEPFWVHQLVIHMRLEQCTEAFDLGPRAAERFSDSAAVFAFYGLSAVCVGDVEAAKSAIQRSLELNPNQQTLRQTLGALGGS